MEDVVEAVETPEVTEIPDSQEAAPSGEREISEFETKVIDLAKSVGWSPDGPKSAEDYLKSLPARLMNRNNEIKHLKKTVEGIAKSFEVATQAQYQKGIEDATARMLAAKESYDFAAYERAQAELQHIQTLQTQSKSVTTIPEVDDFVERNPWFDKDKEMTADALDYKEKYLRANPGADPSEVLAYVEKRIKRDYPEKFTTEKTDEPVTARPKQPSAVEGVRSANTSAEPWMRYEKQLTQLEKDMMESMTSQVHNGKQVMTKKQYIESLVSAGRFERG